MLFYCLSSNTHVSSRLYVLMLTHDILWLNVFYNLSGEMFRVVVNLNDNRQNISLVKRKTNHKYILINLLISDMVLIKQTSC